MTDDYNQPPWRHDPLKRLAVRALIVALSAVAGALAAIGTYTVLGWL